MNPLKSIYSVLFFFSLTIQNVSANTLPDFTGIVDNNIDAVVIVNAVKSGTTNPNQQFNIPNLPDEFKPFFEKFFENNPNSPDNNIRQTPSFGSGFILSDDGYIMTNNHVISNSNEISITLNDGSVLPAELIGSDERSDLALLKVSAKDLPTVTIGNSQSKTNPYWIFFRQFCIIIST